MNAQIVTVNLIPELSVPAVVRVSQYDVGRPLVFRVMDGMSMATLPQYWYAKVEGTKPSGLGFSESCTISGSTVTVSTTEAMTQECGQIFAEISFTHTGVVIGTANFILAVEPSPHPEGTTDGTQDTMANLETRLQAEIDDLSDRIDDIEAGGSGLPSTEKQLILTLFSKAAYAEDDAGTAYDALEDLWTTTTRTITYDLSHVSSSNTTASIESGQSYTTTLTASTNYTLNTVTVTMGGVDITSTSYSSGTVSIPSVTGNIVITATAVAAVSSISAVYTPSGTVYIDDALDSLKSDLVVTATYTGGTTATIPSSEYTLSGSLTVGTSTITVSYGGQTTTFTVTVSEHWSYSIDDLTKVTGVYASDSNANCGMKLDVQSNYRRSFAVDSGATSVALANVNTITSQTSDYFPIKIPAGATSCTISVTPNTQYVQVLARTLTDGVFSTFSTSGWSGYQEGGGTKTFTAAPDNAYFFITLKYNDAGTSYPTEPTAFDLLFE